MHIREAVLRAFTYVKSIPLFGEGGPTPEGVKRLLKRCIDEPQPARQGLFPLTRQNFAGSIVDERRFTSALRALCCLTPARLDRYRSAILEGLLPTLLDVRYGGLFHSGVFGYVAHTSSPCRTHPAIIIDFV